MPPHYDEALPMKMVKPLRLRASSRWPAKINDSFAEGAGDKSRARINFRRPPTLGPNIMSTCLSIAVDYATHWAASRHASSRIS